MLVLLGVNHESAPLEVRERLAFQDAELVDGALDRLIERPGIDEAMVLSTCNRVEVLVRADEPRRGVAGILDFLAEDRGVDGKQLEQCTYHFVDREAARHLFRVAAVVRNDWKPGTPNEIERMMDVTDDALIIAGDDPDPYAEPAYRKAYNLVRAIARRYAETA